MKLTYKEAYDKIIEAYFKDEIKPMDPEFCFCGTLCNGNKEWASHTNPKKKFGFTARELARMESALLTPLIEIGVLKSGNYRGNWYRGRFSENDKDYEDLLFKGMSDALDVLRDIYKENGENTEETENFVKRTLKPEVI